MIYCLLVTDFAEIYGRFDASAAPSMRRPVDKAFVTSASKAGRSAERNTALLLAAGRDRSRRFGRDEACGADPIVLLLCIYVSIFILF